MFVASIASFAVSLAIIDRPLRVDLVVLAGYFSTRAIAGTIMKDVSIQNSRSRLSTIVLSSIIARGLQVPSRRGSRRLIASSSHRLRSTLAR